MSWQISFLNCLCSTVAQSHTNMGQNILLEGYMYRGAGEIPKTPLSHLQVAVPTLRADLLIESSETSAYKLRMLYQLF